jgi:hypothetical protein
MIAARFEKVRGQAAAVPRSRERLLILAAINLLLLGLSAFLIWAPQAPSVMQLLGRMLAFAVALEWSVALLEHRLPAPLKLARLPGARRR